MILVTRRLSDQSVVCSVLTSPFSTGSAHLQPRPRWYQKKYQVPGTIYNGKSKKNNSKRAEPSRTMQWKSIVLNGANSRQKSHKLNSIRKICCRLVQICFVTTPLLLLSCRCVPVSVYTWSLTFSPTFYRTLQASTSFMFVPVSCVLHLVKSKLPGPPLHHFINIGERATLCSVGLYRNSMQYCHLDTFFCTQVHSPFCFSWSTFVSFHFYFDGPYWWLFYFNISILLPFLLTSTGSCWYIFNTVSPPLIWLFGLSLFFIKLHIRRFTVSFLLKDSQSHLCHISVFYYYFILSLVSKSFTIYSLLQKALI